jgi:XisI protein
MAIKTIETQASTTSQKRDRYRQAIVQFLTQFCDDSNEPGEIETQKLFDLQADRYLILSLGWRGQERVYNVLIHLDIQDEKVWIQRNQTENEIEGELMDLGVLQEDIIRGLITPEYRNLAGLN